MLDKRHAVGEAAVVESRADRQRFAAKAHAAAAVGEVDQVAELPAVQSCMTRSEPVLTNLLNRRRGTAAVLLIHVGVLIVGWFVASS
jgi:hypothetical protein